MERDRAYGQAVSVLPPRLRSLALGVSPKDQSRAEEVRLRAGQAMTLVMDGKERSLGGAPVQTAELEQLVELASRASLHAVLDQLRQGYLTLAGGHRIGLCGSARLREGEIRGLQPYSSANVRIARSVRGIAGPLLARLCPRGSFGSTLILAPPGAGKTTLLRDLVRSLSDGEGTEPLRVSLADERGEVAALRGGIPQLEVGARTDVLEGCPKARAMMLLLRAMNPQVLAADEITDPADIQALRQAAGCGVALLATAHGLGREDLQRRILYRPALEEGLFQRLVTIRREGEKRIYTVEVLEA